MFKTSDLNIVKKILTYCYLGDWWVLYQLGRNSNTHFFRYLLRHIEHDFALKEKRALREERRRHRRPPGNKGQKISKGNFDVLISPKIQTRGLVSTGAMASLAPVIWGISYLEPAILEQSKKLLGIWKNSITLSTRNDKILMKQKYFKDFCPSL